MRLFALILPDARTKYEARLGIDGLRAECEAPPFYTDRFDTFEQAIVAGAKQAGDELQAAVNERPIIAGKITPAEIRGMF